MKNLGSSSSSRPTYSVSCLTLLISIYQQIWILDGALIKMRIVYHSEILKLKFSTTTKYHAWYCGTMGACYVLCSCRGFLGEPLTLTVYQTNTVLIHHSMLACDQSSSSTIFRQCIVTLFFYMRLIKCHNSALARNGPWPKLFIMPVILARESVNYITSHEPISKRWKWIKNCTFKLECFYDV